MTDDQNEGASVAGFFDEFNKDKDKQAVIEDVNRKLCEVLTELAEDLADALIADGASSGARRGADSGTPGTSAEQQPAAAPDGDGEVAAAADNDDNCSNGVDQMAALAAYNDALAAIMREKDMSSKDVCALPDDHPLKELFFSAFDPQMFHELLERFIGQVRSRKGGIGEWDAEAADGECDEDHTLE